MSDAVFIPPAYTEVPDLMSDLEQFLHNEKIRVPDLIKIAIAHYQFETIHPFLDGNGRIGRLLITLYLVSKKILQTPSLYLSDFFEKNRSSYYDALSKVRESDDLNHWLKFFLNAIVKTSENGKDTFTNILKLKGEIDSHIVTFNRRAENARKLAQYLYCKPIVNVNQVKDVLQTGKKAARELINDFENLNILQEITGYKRNRIFVFKKYLDLF